MASGVGLAINPPLPDSLFRNSSCVSIIMSRRSLKTSGSMKGAWPRKFHVAMIICFWVSDSCGSLWPPPSPPPSPSPSDIVSSYFMRKGRISKKKGSPSSSNSPRSGLASFAQTVQVTKSPTSRSRVSSSISCWPLASPIMASDSFNARRTGSRSATSYSSPNSLKP